MDFDKRKLIVPALFLLLLSISVSAQSTNIFESIKSVFGNQDFGTLYTNYWWIIDMIVYLFFFGYIGRLTMGQQFQQRGGPLGVVVGVALAISVVFFESKSGFRLGNIGPFGLAVALVIFAIVVWQFFQGMGLGAGASLAWVFVAIYGFLLTVANPLFQWIAQQNSPWLNLLSAILNIMLLISIFAIIWNIGRWVPGLFQGGQNPLQNILNPQQQQPAQPQQQQAAQQAQQAAQAQQRQQQIAQVLQRLNNLQNRILAATQQQQVNQQQLVNELANAIAELIQLRQQIQNIP